MPVPPHLSVRCLSRFQYTTVFLPADPVPSSDHSAVFALLDEADAPAGAPRSRLLSGWLGEWRCDDPATLEAVWSGAQQGGEIVGKAVGMRGHGALRRWVSPESRDGSC